MEVVVNISKHPKVTGIKRKARYKSINVSEASKALSLHIGVEHYNTS